MTDTFLVSDSESLTYPELDKKKNDLIQRLGKPKPVLLEADRNINTVVRFLSLIEGGHTVLMVPSWDFKDAEFRAQLKQLSQTDFLPWGMASELPEGEAKTFHSLIRKGLENKSGRFLVRTSGSSGKFKLVLHDPELFFRKYKLIGKHFERTFFFSPADSIAGVETILEAYSHRASVAFVSGKISPALVAQTLKSQSVDYFQTTPTFLNLMMLSGVFRTEKPEKLLKIAFGSEPAQASVLSHIKEKWSEVSLLQTYGMSEIGIQKTLFTDDPVYFHLDEKHNPGRIKNGLLEISSLTPLVAYLNFDSQITSDGWFMTHDEVREKGKQLSVPGREGELLNIAGRKFFPSEVEEFLMKVSGILDVIVRAEKDEFAGTILHAEIFIDPEVSETEMRKKLKDFLGASVPPHMHPQKITIGTELPQNGRFKKMRKA
ncbi:MAG: AMP-binding protein [Bdellovibrionota bacterium]